MEIKRLFKHIMLIYDLKVVKNYSPDKLQGI